MGSGFILMMTLLNVGASFSLFADKQYALGICFLCYAVANTAMIWVIK